MEGAMTFSIIYPDERVVTEDWLRSRYADMMADDFVCREKLDTNEPGDLNRLSAHWWEWRNEDISVIKETLSDAGFVTFANRR
jgi:hypothetical protein